MLIGYDIAMGSIQWHTGAVPPVAIDIVNKRFAVAGPDAITMIEITSDE